MPTDDAGTSHEQRFNEVLAAYLDALEAGQKPDRRAWLERYPELAADLAEFFANRDQLLPPSLSAAPAIGPRSGRVPSAAAGPERLPAFGDYEILAEIARGGMGVVYKARQISLKRIVA